MRKRRLPPRRTCPGCGREHRSYNVACNGCLNDGKENRSSLAEMAREERLKRRGELDNLDPPVRPGGSETQGELPTGF